MWGFNALYLRQKLPAMNKNLIRLPAMLIAVLLISCTQKKLTQAQQQKQAPAAPAITYLRMERTPCFGRCPSYAFEIKDDGMVRYSGYMFTQHSGVYEIGIGAPNAARLLKEFAAYRPDTCQDDYEVPIPDLAGLNYTITFSNSETKNIRNAHFGPAFLKHFAEQLDRELLVDDSWRIIADTATR